MIRRAHSARAGVGASLALASIAALAAAAGSAWSRSPAATVTAALSLAVLALLGLPSVRSSVGLSWAWLRLRARLGRRSDDPAGRAQLGVLWRATEDFDARGFARRELDELRLIALNLDGDARPVGRLGARLDGVVSRVLGGVLDRAEDVAHLARRRGVAPGAVRDVERGVAALATQLQGWRADAAERLDADLPAVARAAAQVVDGCLAVRDALRPAVACNVAPLLLSLARTRGGPSRAKGGLVVELRGRLDGRVRAAVSAADLASALDGLLERAATESDGGQVGLAADAGDDRVTVRVRWAPEGRRPASDLLAPLRRLASYGVRSAVTAGLGGGSSREVLVVLPRLASDAWTAGPPRGARVTDAARTRATRGARRR